MSSRRLLEIALILTIVVLSVEILVRRWYFHQIPTQIDGGWIYLLLGANVVWLLRSRPTLR